MAKYQVSTTGQFKKDLKRAKKRGLNLQDLIHVVELLANDEPLPENNHDHNLQVTMKATVNATFPQIGCLFI